MQRLTIRATTRRGRDADDVAAYLVKLALDSGAANAHGRGAMKKRGGGVQVIADAEDAVAVMNALRMTLDGETNGYALDTLNELVIGAFESSAGGFLGFVNEDYRVQR